MCVSVWCKKKKQQQQQIDEDKPHQGQSVLKCEQTAYRAHHSVPHFTPGLQLSFILQSPSSPLPDPPVPPAENGLRTDFH